MRPRALTLIVLAVLVICSCTRRGSSPFEKERVSIQSWLGRGARLVNTAAPRENGYATEASWECAFTGDVGAAKNTFRQNVPAEYKLSREGDRELAYAKYDGHDSFYLTLSFDSAKPDATTVRVVLRSVPD